VPLALYVRGEGGNVTSMNLKEGLRHTPSNFKAPPDVRKFYDNNYIGMIL